MYSILKIVFVALILLNFNVLKHHRSTYIDKSEQNIKSGWKATTEIRGVVKHEWRSRLPTSQEINLKSHTLKMMGNHLKCTGFVVNGLQNAKLTVRPYNTWHLFHNFPLSVYCSGLFQKLRFSECGSGELLYNRDLFEEIEGNQPFLLPIGYSNQALHWHTEREKMCNYFHIISSERKIGAAKV